MSARDFACHPTGRGLFQRHSVKRWDTATGKELHDLAGHLTYFNVLEFSPDGKYLVTCSEPLSDFAQQQLKLPANQVFVWEVATGKPVAQLPLGATKVGRSGFSIPFPANEHERARK